jgi:hypothetical protein
MDISYNPIFLENMKPGINNKQGKETCWRFEGRREGIKYKGRGRKWGKRVRERERERLSLSMQVNENKLEKI